MKSIYVFLTSLLAITLFFAGNIMGQAPDLFISEYIEGSSNNKALEIYNGTGASVSLDDYFLIKVANPSGTETWADGTVYSFTSGASIADADVYVVYNSSAGTGISSVGDETSGACTFNGNDPVALIKDMNANGVYDDGTDQVLDAIGDFTGTYWGSDLTWVRMDSYDGNSTFTLAEWNEYAQDEFSYLGSHTYSGGGGTDPTISVSPSSLSGFTYVVGNGPSSSQSFDVSGSNLTGDITVTPPTNYEISTDDATFQSTAISLTQSGGSVASTTLYARLKAGLAEGDYNSETITLTSSGATDKTVTCSGSVTSNATTIFSEDFETTSGDGITLIENELSGWTNYNETGSIGWYSKEYGGTKYMQMASYGTGEANTAWVVTPAIDLTGYTNTEFSFDVKIGYWTHDGLTVHISTDFDGSDVASATWDDVTSNFTIPQTPTGGYGNFVDAGTMDLSAYSGAIYIAYKYTGDDNASQTTTYQVDNISVTGTTGGSTPSISVSPTSLSGFSYVEGSGPSTSQSFTVSGSNLSDDITVSPPTNYEISSDDANYQSTAITLTQSGGSVASTTLYARLKAGLAEGDYNNEDINLTSSGAASKTITCSGSVTSSATMLFSEDFETTSGDGTTLIENELTGWTNYNEAGTVGWYSEEYGGTKYMQMSAYGTGEADTAWIVTPAIDLTGYTNTEFTFDVNIGYWTHDGLTVYISTDFDGSNVTSATWDNVTANFTIPQTPTGGYGDFVNAGTMDLSAYPGTIYIAYKYTGDDNAGQTTTYQVDNIEVSGEAGGTTPIITLSTSSLDFENVYSGYTSRVQRYTVEGADLADDISITAPTGYELATSCSGTYSNTLTLNQSGGTVASTTIYARFAPGSYATFTGNIAHSSGSTTENISVDETNTASNIPGSYYSSATSTGQELKAQLNQIVKDHVERTYAELWTDFQSTDVKPNGNVWDIYSDKGGCYDPPYEYIFITDQCGTYNNEGDCYNREHSFPQGWFGTDDDTVYTDLFHLYPTDGTVNGERGSFEYGEVSSPTFTSLNGSKVGPNAYTGSSGATAFEPIDEVKGDIARTYFYLATRYANRITSWTTSPMIDGDISDEDGSVFEEWALNMLINWHNLDPVSQKEMTRNDSIYNIQNNRNPFVDHPEFVDSVWNTTYVSPPAITNVTIDPASPTTADDVSVYADITDNLGIDSAKVYWSTVSSTLDNEITMSVDIDDTYLSDNQIPAQSQGAIVYYQVKAWDNEANLTETQVFDYTVSAVASGDLFISEVADPADEYTGRFVEIYNPSSSDISLTGWQIRRYANGNTTSSDVDLSGTLAAGQAYVIAYDSVAFNTFYGFYPNTSSGSITGNGDDVYELFNGSSVIDIYGEVGVDGTGELWEYEDAIAYRNSDIASGNTVWTETEWTIVSPGNTTDATPGTHNTSVTVPEITISSPNQVGDGNIAEGTSNNILSQFEIAAAVESAYLEQIAFTTAGTYVETDITNLKLWANPTSTITGADEIASITTAQGPGSHTFNNLNQSIGIDSTIHFFITADVPFGSTVSSTINVDAIPGSDFTFTIGTITGSVTAGGIQTIVEGNDNTSVAVAPPNQTPPANISSIANTQAEAVEVFRFVIEDAASGDGLPTIVTQMKFITGPQNTISINEGLAGGYFEFADGTSIAMDGEPVSTATETIFNIQSGSLTIADGASEEIVGHVWLEDSITDGEIVQFMIDADNHGFIADPSGSAFADVFTADIVGNEFTIDVVATQLAFKQQPTDVTIGTTMTPPVEIAATDMNGNVDTSFVENIQVTVDGTILTGSPVVNTPVSGIATFDNLVFEQGSPSSTLIAEREATTDWDIYSEPFAVISGPSIVSLPIEKNFEDSVLTSGGWFAKNVTGTQEWHVDMYDGNKFAKMSGYEGGSNENEDWLISPPFNADNYSSIEFDFFTAKNYTGNDIEVLVSDNYDGLSDPNTATWNTLSATLSSGSFNWAYSGLIDLSSTTGSYVFVAFKYTSTNTESATWQVDSISVREPSTDPVISNIANTPANPTSSETVSVSADITDIDGTISNAELYWGLTSGSLTNTIAMSYSGSGDSYITDSDIPTQVDGTTVYYEILAEDNDGNTTISDEQNYLVYDGPSVVSLPIEKNFEDNSLTSGGWFAKNVTGTQEWYVDMYDGNKFAKMSGYDGGSNENEDWLISPPFNADNYSNIEFDFFTAKNYAGNDLEVLISDNYDGISDPNTATWNTLSATLSSGSFDWTYSGLIDLSSTTGTFVFVAYKYTSTNSESATWEVDSISIREPSGNPVISNVTNTPESPTSSQTVSVSADITDIDGTIANAELHWGLTPGSLTNMINMSYSGTGDAYVTDSDIPAQDNGTIVYYEVFAEDNDGNTTTTDEFSYEVYDGPTVVELPIEKTFEDGSLTSGGWFTKNVIGAQEWYVDTYDGNKFAKMSGYEGSSNENEDWLISPPFNADNYGTITFDFFTAMNYTGNDLEIMTSNDYDGLSDPNTATWNTLSANLSPGSWEWTYSGLIDISSVTGDFVFVAYKYTSTSSESATWEVDSIYITGYSEGAPVISNVAIDPEEPTPDDDVNVSANIIDDGTIQSAELLWGLQETNVENVINMSLESGSTYITDNAIPAQSAGTTVYYYIRATDDETLSDSTDVTSYTVLEGIGEVGNTVINIYPNPTSGQFTVKLGEKADYRMNIYSSLGQLIYADEINKKQIKLDLNDRNTGIYYIQLINLKTGDVMNQKIVIQ